jgi:PAS domain S-box-containing protein
MAAGVWDRCRVEDKAFVFPQSAWAGLWGRSLIEKKALYLNDSLKLPEGHVSLSSALVAPIIHRSELIGQLAVANKPSGYDEQDRRLLETIAGYVAPILQARIAGDRDKQRRRRAEGALRESEVHLRAIFEAAENVSLITTDLAGTDTRIVDFSPGAERIFGYKREEIVGRRLAVLHLPEDAARFPEVIDILRRTKKGLSQETTLVRKGGEEFPALLSVYPMVDAEDRMTGVLGVAVDITERMQAEESLREGEQRFRTSIENMLDCFGIYSAIRDPSGRIVDFRIEYVNAAACASNRMGREEQVGGRLCELMPAHRETGLFDEYCQVVETGKPLVKEALLYEDSYGADRRSRAFDIRAAKLGDGFTAAWRDVTERKRAEQERRELEAQIQHAQKLESLGVLAGGIAHDFNNLLAVIIGNADLALRDLSDVSPARPSIDEIKTAGMRATKLTNQMLAYSGRGRFAVTALNLNELVEEMGRLLEVSISKKISLYYDLAAELPTVEADVAQMQQLVMNLITNASEAIGDDAGAVVVRTGVIEADPAYLSATYLGKDLPPGPYVYLEVADTGCGMDADAQSKIFDPFYTSKFTGRGLGLSAVLGIMRGHRGAIRIDSKVGEGTTFRLLLPCSAGPADQEGEPAGGRRSGRAEHGPADARRGGLRRPDRQARPRGRRDPPEAPPGGLGGAPGRDHARDERPGGLRRVAPDPPRRADPAVQRLRRRRRHQPLRGARLGRIRSEALQARRPHRQTPRRAGRVSGSRRAAEPL